MRRVRSVGVLLLAAAALLGVQVQGAQAKLTPAQTVLKEARKSLYDLELEREKDASKFAADEVKAAAKSAKYRVKAAQYAKESYKIRAVIAKLGSQLTEAKREHLLAIEAADEAKAAAEEAAAAQAEAAAAKAAAKHKAVLVALGAQRIALEAQIVLDEEAVEAEGL